jgi:hypothetical protein
MIYGDWHGRRYDWKEKESTLTFGWTLGIENDSTIVYTEMKPH